MSTNPWDPHFTPAEVNQDLIKNVEAAVTAGEQVVSTTAQTAQEVATQATAAVEGAVSGAVNAIVPPPGGAVTASGTGGIGGVNIPQANVTDLAGTLENVITTAAKGSVEKALLSLAPDLQAELIKEWQAGLNRVIIKVSGGTAAPPTPNLTDFVHADARSRALRSLLIGLVVAVLTGLTSIAGQLAGVNWLDHGGRIAAASLAIGSVVSSLAAYVTRLISEPEVTKPLTAQLPEKQLP